MIEFNPNMITVAAKARGLNYTQISEKIGVEPGTLSKIVNGGLKIRKDILEKISEVLNFPMSFFYEQINILPPNIAHYRKRKTLNHKHRLLVESNLYIKKHIIKKLLKSVDLETNIFDLNPYDCGSPENAANLLRQKWNISNGPISNMVQLLESAGIIVLHNNINDEKFSGEFLNDEDGFKIIYVNKDHSPDRQRFTLAHELGHIIMHGFDYIPSTPEEAENEADRFASEFLMPEYEIAPYLFNLNLSKAGELKAHWRCSMASIITRAYHLKIINKSRWTSLFVQLSQSGYKKKEPDFGIKQETPSLIYKLMDMHIKQLDFSDADFSTLFSLNEEEVKTMRQFYYPSTLKVA